MKSWQIKKLGEVVDINPPKSEVSNLAMGTAVSFVSMASINENVGTISNMQTKKLENVKNGYTYFANNDVLFAKITPCMENGKVTIAQNLQNGIGFGTTEVYVLRPTNQVLSEWIYSNVSRDQFRTEAKKHMTGSAGQQRVPKEFLENVKISVPPINYQKKIVERLDAIRKAQELCDQQIQKTEELFESILMQDINRGLNSWSKNKLGGSVAYAQLGLIKARQNQVDKGTPYLKMDTIQTNGELNMDKAVFVVATDLEINNFKLEDGDFLFNTRNTPELVGKSAVFSSDELYLFNNNILRLRFKNILPIFLNAYLHTPEGKRQLNLRKKGTTSVSAIYQSSLFDIDIPTPSIDEQQKIVQKLEVVQNYKKILLKQKKLLKELFDSVLDKSMKGELDG